MSVGLSLAKSRWGQQALKLPHDSCNKDTTCLPYGPEETPAWWGGIEGLQGQELMVAPRLGEGCEAGRGNAGIWETTARAPQVMERLKLAAGEMLKKKRVSGCAAFPGHVKDSLLAYFLFLSQKPVIFMIPWPQLPAGSCPPLPAAAGGAVLGVPAGTQGLLLLRRRETAGEQSWGEHPSSPRAPLPPGQPVRARPRRKRCLSCPARSVEIFKHFLSQTGLQNRKLGKVWELFFSSVRKGCAGNI